jgi:hypothetical protein
MGSSDVGSVSVPWAPVSLGLVERAIEASRRKLRELWWKASTADRLFAIDRLLREDLVAPPVLGELQRVQDRVRDAWATARAVSAFGINVPADAQLAGLQLTIAERDRDNFLEQERLFDALFMAAEGYLRSAPLGAGGSFRELVHERDRLRAKIVPILPPVDDAAE